ncbi:hypothetical protein EVAR_76422_1 [Eumeta japonica]|uniref:Reverse transcriptase domain-containing protein n=1 Tax=Eumeta variegata TaxID=151549 RepID=A0A4C1T8Y0_EUMVA|nr:hypothetical protein EVAR_76422_1 [Eumeta japonica]
MSHTKFDFPFVESGQIALKGSYKSPNFKVVNAGRTAAAGPARVTSTVAAARPASRPPLEHFVDVIMKSFCRFINRRKGHVSMPNTMTYGDRTPHDDHHVCELFPDSIFNKDTVNGLDSYLDGNTVSGDVLVNIVVSRDEDLKKIKQLVKNKGPGLSAPILVISGVPQGSHLDLLLFILINDLVAHLSCMSLLYADDLKIFAPIRNVNDCAALIWTCYML